MSTAIDITMKVLYVKGTAGDADESTLQQLRSQAAELEITVAVSSAAALAEIRRTRGWQALLLSPALPQNEGLALIASVRRDRVPIAIVPIVDEAHQDVFASAVAAGADDVLMRRAQTLVNVAETLTRIRQSPHLFPAEQRGRLTILYAGRDPLVWNLLEQVPFVKAEKIAIGPDGSCPIRAGGAADGPLRGDAVVIDEQPGEAHPLQVLKSIKAQASDLPVIVLTATTGGDIATAALDLGADDTVVKTGIFRRRLVAALRRVHQRLELSSQQIETKAREERLRQIVEIVPAGITVIAADGVVLAMNAAALQFFGATKPREIVGRDVRQLAIPEHHDSVTAFIGRVVAGEATAMEVTAITLAGQQIAVRLHGVVLERDARGGRGVLASITPARGDLIGGVSTTGELADLRDSLGLLQAHHAEIEDARSADRTTWDAERRALSARADVAEHAIAEQASLAATMNEAAAELARLREAAAHDRQELESRARELEQAAHQAVSAEGARREVEDALAAATAQVHDLTDTVARERGEWQTVKDALESRVQHLDDAHATQSRELATLTTSQGDLDALRDVHARERDEQQARQVVLETELRRAREALWAEHGERDAVRERFESELRDLRERLATERADWELARSVSQQDVASERERAATLERDLAAARGEHDAERARAIEAADGERREWHATRGRLEQEAHAGNARAEALDAEVASLRAQLDADRATAHTTFDDERRQRDAEHADAIARLRAEHTSHVSALDADAQAACARVDAELTSLRAQLDADRATAHAAFDDERRQRDTEHADAIARLRAEHTSHVSALDADAQDAHARVDAELTSLRAQLDADRATAHAAFDDERRQRDTEHADAVARLRAEHASRVSALEAGAEDARADAEATAGRLQTLQEEHRNASVETYQQLERERETWRATHTRLEDDARAAADRASALDTELADLRTRLDAAEERARIDAANARRAWDEERQTIERELASARDLADHTSRDLDTARAAHDSGRQVWDSLRASLEDDLHRSRDEAQALRRDADAARADADWRYGETVGRAERAEQEREAVRRQLDDERRLATETLAAAHEQWDVERGALDADARTRSAEHEAELQRGLDALTAKQREWDEQHAELEGLLRRAHEDADSLQRELEATQAQLERDREDTRQAADRERLAWESTRTALEREVDEHRTAADAVRQDLSARVAELTASLDVADRRGADRDALDAALEAARAEITHTDAMHAGHRADWDADRARLETELRDRQAELAAERSQWREERASFDARMHEAEAAREHVQRLDAALNALRTDYATMVQTLAAERSVREETQRDADRLRETIAGAERHLADVRRQHDDEKRAAERHAAQRDADHAARVRALDDQLVAGAQRLARVTSEADATRLALQAEYLRASEGHTRLTASGLFAYAVTTLPGELVRCNDAFAQLFGFDDAPDALTRTAGRLFPGVSGRTAFVARLSAEGHVDGIESCVERHDGQAVRIVESATLLTEGDQVDDETLVEHVIVGRAGGPDPDELRARRLEEVGALTTAMIPEIETLIATAHERAHDLRRLLRDAGVGDGDSETMAALTSQVNALVRQLATFSRRQIRGVEAVDLAEAVTRTEPVLLRLVGDYVGFAMHLAPAPPVLLNPDDLDQLLTSMVTFARDLLPAGGSLSVDVRPPARTAETDGPAATALMVTASGYGVQLPSETPSLDVGARRCGGRLQVSGDPGWTVRIEVLFARCGNAPKAGWSWLGDES